MMEFEYEIEVDDYHGGCWVVIYLIRQALTTSRAIRVKRRQFLHKLRWKDYKSEPEVEAEVMRWIENYLSEQVKTLGLHRAEVRSHPTEEEDE